MKHKKKVLLVLLILIVSLSTLLLSVASFTPEKEITGNLFAIMLEEDDGSYYESDLEIFPDNYIYNAEKTYCVNGSVVNWDNTNKVANIKADGSEKCYIYFDKLFKDFTYTGNYQTYVASETGSYKIEAWGAQGTGSKSFGAYTAGYINLIEGEILYVYVGGKGDFNGGKTYYPGPDRWTITTGGATDVRLTAGAWDSAIGLRSRIIVSAGGASAASSGTGSNAGGLYGYDGSLTTASNYSTTGKGASQTAGGAAGEFIWSYAAPTAGAFGIPGIGSVAYGGSSGGGYYTGGGCGVKSGSIGSGGSGSSYISGHTGAVAITSASNQSPKSGCTSGTTNNVCSIHYSGKTFTNTVMIDGAGYNWTNVKGSQTAMPSPSGGTYALGVGHAGNGYARITLIK